MSDQIIPDASGRLMTFEALRSQRDNLRGRMVRIVNTIGKYWRPNYNGHTDHVEDAGRFPVSRVLSDLIGRTDVLLELVDDSKPTEEQKKKILIGPDQAESFREKIADKMCRIVSWSPGHSDHGKYWRRPLGTGCTSIVEDALTMRIGTVLANNYHNCKIEMLDQEMADEISKLPFRKCNLSHCIPATLTLSLQLQPNNPTYRALLLKTFGVMPPDNLTDYTALKDWIEFNCDPVAHTHPPPAPPVPARTDNRFVVRLSFSDEEYGNCNYSVNRNGHGEYGFSEADIQAIVRNAVNYEDVKTAIEHKLHDDSWSCGPQMQEQDSSYTYEDYESSDEQRQQWTHRDSAESRSIRLLAYLLQHLTREEQQRIGIFRADEHIF